VGFHREGGIYRGEWDLHRIGEVGLVLGGGRRPSNVAGQLGGAASSDFLHRTASNPSQPAGP
jgi:hypothetical protein